MGLLDFKVDVVLARLEAGFNDQPPSIPAVPNRRVSLQCPTAECPSTAEYPCSAQPHSILKLPNRKVSLQCSATKYPCSAQPQSIPAMPNCKVSLQCPTAEYQGPTEKYPSSAQPRSIPGVPNSRVSIFLQRICSAARKGGRETLHFFAITALGSGCSK